VESHDGLEQGRGGVTPLPRLHHESSDVAPRGDFCKHDLVVEGVEMPGVLLAVDLPLLGGPQRDVEGGRVLLEGPCGQLVEVYVVGAVVGAHLARLIAVLLSLCKKGSAHGAF